MKNILMNTIKYGSILGFGMIAFAGQALAAPILTPSSITSLSDTKATLVSKVFNQAPNNITVWFEWGTTPAPTTVIGLTDIFQQGYFQANLDKLTPGATYYFRAVAFENGAMVYSPIVSFTTTGGIVPVGLYAQPIAPIVASAPLASIQDITPTEQKKVSVSQAVNKNTITDIKKVKVAGSADTALSESALNSNSATVLGAGESILPGTLIAWLGLFISILIAVILVRMIIESNEKRKKMLEQAKLKKLQEAPLAA